MRHSAAVAPDGTAMPMFRVVPLQLQYVVVVAAALVVAAVLLAFNSLPLSSPGSQGRRQKQNNEVAGTPVGLVRKSPLTAKGSVCSTLG